MKPTKTAEELKTMIRRHVGGSVTVNVLGRPDGTWAFATGSWSPTQKDVEAAMSYGHSLQREFDIKQPPQSPS